MVVVGQGIPLQDSLTLCTTDLCAQIYMRSPDISRDLSVDLVDLAIFAPAFPPGTYAACSDINADGIIDLIDLAVFAFHFGPPGHACN
jgi:hypothetical protein